MNKMLLDYNEKPSTGRWITLSFQHVFAMFSATVLVPILTGLPISIALFSAGVGTLIYILCTKGKVPMFLGSSFAYLGYMSTVLYITNDNGDLLPNPDGGRGALIAGVVLVGLIYIIVSLIIKFVGKNWLHKLLPPIVVGPMIIVIGLCLAGSAVSNAGLNINGSFIEVIKNGSWKSIVISLTTLIVTAILAIRGKGFFKIIPFLIGIIAGYLIGLVINWLPGAHVFNFEELINTVTTPSQWFKLPEITLIGWKDADLGLGISMAKVKFTYLIPVIPLALATICEHIGDHQVLGNITGKDYTINPGLDKTLLGDGIATLFAGVIGSVPNTSYGENTAVVGMTKVGSVWVTGLAAIIAILLSFFNVFTQLIHTIPNAVMGGVCLVLYGFIAANGLKVLVDAKVNIHSTRNIIIISIMLIIGLGGAKIFGFTGMSLASIFGILLNLILPKEKNNENQTI